MKNYIFLILFFSAFILDAKSKTNKKPHNYIINGVSNLPGINQDTIKYLQDSIVAYKEKFKHKELNVMLKELHLTVKYYFDVRGSKPGAAPKCIQLFFEDSNVTSYKIRKQIVTPSLNVYFENEIPWNEAWKIRYQGKGVWLKAEQDFYGKMLVKDIAGVSK